MLRLAVIGDVHYWTGGPREAGMLLHRSREILETALCQIVRLAKPPDLIVQIGDLIEGTGQSPSEALADLERAVALLDGTGLRWTWVAGNHDVAFCDGRRAMLAHLGRPRSYGEMEIGDNVLLLLDSAQPEVYGRIDAEQQAWLERALEKHRNRRVFVILHHVFDWSVEHEMYIEDGERIRAMLLGTRAVKAVVAGHVHTHRIDTTDGMHEIAVGALTGWPLRFTLIEIEADRLRVTTERVAVSPEVEREALAAYEAHIKPWRPPIRDRDLAADLPLRARV